MKKLSLLFLLFISQFMISQVADPLLYDREWYISFIQIDNQFYTLPDGLEFEESLIVFSENNPHFAASICSSLEGDIERVINDNSFGFPNGLTLDEQLCDELGNTDFDALHFNFYLDNINEIFTYDYYVIEPFFTAYVTITAPNGDIVEYYSDLVMSVDEFQLSQISLFPNPLQDKLQIASPLDGDFGYKIFDLLGQSVMGGLMNASETLDVSNLNRGMYLMKLTYADKLVRSFKIVKN